MENKYFTPDIEDICIGYECEINNIHGKWESITITFTNSNSFYKTDLAEVCLLVEDKYVRVPYLTKEQLETEGWKYLSEGYAEHQAFYKDDFQMSCFYDKHLLKIIKKESSKTIVLYQGSCRCINDLKKIIKLLEI